jgi:hypothetical protein
MSNNSGPETKDTPDEKTSYALIPIQRDIVAEIDSARDGLSRSEYIRLLFKQTQENELQIANEHSSRITASTVDSEDTNAVADAAPDLNDIQDETASKTTSPHSRGTNQRRSRSSDGGTTIDHDVVTGPSTHADQTPQGAGDEVYFGAPRQTRSSPTVGSFGNLHRDTPNRNETKRNGESSPLKQDRSRSTPGRGTSFSPPQSDTKSTARPDGQQSQSQDEHAFRREGTTTITGVDRHRQRRDPERGARSSDTQSQKHKTPESQRTRETSNEGSDDASADTQKKAHTEDGANSNNDTNGEQMTPQQSREARGERRAVEETANEANTLTPGWNLSIGIYIIVWALAVGMYGAGDTVTTIYALASGVAVETNPIIRAAINIHPVVMLIVKLAILGGLFKLADSMASKSYLSVDDQIAILIPTVLTAIGGYGTFVNLQNLNGSMIPYVLLTIIFVGIAGGATVALYEGLPLAGNKLKNYQFSKPVSSVGNESSR